MFFNTDAYKKAFPETETKPAARTVEKTCELYDENDERETTPKPDEIDEPAEEANDGDDAEIGDDDTPDGGVGEEV